MRALRIKLGLGTLACIAALASFSAGSTSAALHPSLGILAKGIPQGAGTQLFDDACGLATDPAANLYLSDYHHGYVARFASELAPTPSGPQLALSYSGPIASAQTENSPCALATDAAGDLYANNFDQGVVRYPAPGFGAPATIDPERATGVAVDQATGTLYVTHRTHVSAYAPPVAPAAPPTQALGLGTLTDAYGLAVSGFAATAGYLYVADAGDDTVAVFDPATDPLNPVQVIDGNEVPPGEFRDLTNSALAIDDSSGHLFVLDNLQPGFEHPAAAVYEFDASGTYLGQLPGAFIHGGPSGLAVDNSSLETRGLIYLTSGNEVILRELGPPVIEEGSVLYAFCPSAPLSPGLDEACPAPSPAQVLEVTRAGSGEGTVKSSSPGIDCGVLCATELDQGTQVTLAAAPRPHSAFSGWSVSGQPAACPGSGTCKVTLNAATEVTASFTAIPQRTLAVSKSGAGAGAVTSSPVGLGCGQTCSASFDQGTQVSLNPEPAPGSEFAGWSGACSGMGACKVKLASDQSVGASFRPIVRVGPIDPGAGSRILAISVTGEGAGTITSSPGNVDCGSPCSGAYAPGTTVTLSAKPDEESRFAGFTGCDASTASTCTVTLSSSRTVGAAFAESAPLELAGLSLDGAKALLEVAVPSKGTLSASGKKLKPSSLKAKKAGTLTLPVSLTKAGKRALAKQGRVAIKVTLTFKPADATPARILSKTITFKKGKGRR